MVKGNSVHSTIHSMKFLAAGLLLLCSPLAVSAGTLLAGRVRNTKGQPITGLTIHLYRSNGAGYDHETALTGADGKWSVEVPPGEWWGAARPDELLARGYFCAPGFVWCPELVLCENPGNVWGGGVIEWFQVEVPGEWTQVADGGNIFLVVVPTRPDLTVENPRTSKAGVKVTFETTTLNMTTIRQWRIEKSSDLITWVPMQTVALSGTSPVLVPDPASAETPQCYYRAVQVNDLGR